MEDREWGHYRDVKPGEWPFRYFTPRELACKGTGRLRVRMKAVRALDALRKDLGRPMLVTSAYRSPQHNKAVGGAPASRHMLGDAFDIRMTNHDPHEFVEAAKRAGFTGIGLYPRSGFIHIDMGPARSWGRPFPVTETGLAAEPLREPEDFAEDHQAQAAAGAGAAGAVATVLEVAPAASGLLGNMAPVVQGIAVVAAFGLLAYLLWQRHRR